MQGCARGKHGGRVARRQAGGQQSRRARAQPFSWARRQGGAGTYRIPADMAAGTIGQPGGKSKLGTQSPGHVQWAPLRHHYRLTWETRCCELGGWRGWPTQRCAGHSNRCAWRAGTWASRQAGEQRQRQAEARLDKPGTKFENLWVNLDKWETSEQTHNPPPLWAVGVWEHLDTWIPMRPPRG